MGYLPVTRPPRRPDATSAVAANCTTNARCAGNRRSGFGNLWYVNMITQREEA
jgi:hypothetical protein